MAAEKTCKAHLIMVNGFARIKKSHAYVERHLPAIAKHFYSQLNNAKIANWELEQIRKLAHEIEVLAPGCEAGETRQDNTEYPWLAAGEEVKAPRDYSFSNIDDRSKIIVRLIKLIRTAAEQYAS